MPPKYFPPTHNSDKTPYERREERRKEREQDRYERQQRRDENRWHRQQERDSRDGDFDLDL